MITLHEKFLCLCSGQRTTKLQLAFDALEFANGNVSKAKAIIAESGVRISARTWHKAITARLSHLSTQRTVYVGWDKATHQPKVV